MAYVLSVLISVEFLSTFSHHDNAQANLALLIWLNENVVKS